MRVACIYSPDTVQVRSRGYLQLLSSPINAAPRLSGLMQPPRPYRTAPCSPLAHSAPCSRPPPAHAHSAASIRLHYPSSGTAPNGKTSGQRVPIRYARSHLTSTYRRPSIAPTSPRHKTRLWVGLSYDLDNGNISISSELSYRCGCQYENHRAIVEGLKAHEPK